MNWIEGKPTEPGAYWIFTPVDFNPVELVELRNEVWAGIRALWVWSVGWDQPLNLGGPLDDMSITHHIPIEKPEPPKEQAP